MSKISTIQSKKSTTFPLPSLYGRPVPLSICERAFHVHMDSLPSAINTGSSTVYTLLLLGSGGGEVRKTSKSQWCEACTKWMLW